MTYSSYAPITLPLDFWPSEEQYERTAARMRSFGITPPPRGTLDPNATSALGQGLYNQKSWMESPLLPALVMMGGAAAGGAFANGGAGFGAGAGAGSGGAATTYPLAAGGGPVSVSPLAGGAVDLGELISGGMGPQAAVGGGGASSLFAGSGAKWAMRGAGLVGSSLMSGKGGGGGSGDASAIQSQLALDLYGQTDPLRRALIARSQQYLGGGVDSSAQFGAFKAAADPQFAQARDSVIANTPAGGGLVSALTQLEGQRARTLTQARGGIDEQELARAMTLGTGTTGQSLGTLGNAANTQAMIAQSQADREAGMLGALGMGAGAFFGSKV